jgi:hypothetical protein
MSNDLFGVIALIIILGVGAVAFAPAYVDGADRQSVTNESITVDYATPQSVSESGLEYDDTVTVYNSSGAQLDAGTDYEWNATSGNVTFQNTSATTDGETASISYQYRAASEQHETRAGIAGFVGQALTWLLVLLAGGYVFREVLP